MSGEWQRVLLGGFCSKIGSGSTPKGGSEVYLESGLVSLIRSQNIYNDGFNPNGIVYLATEAAEKLKNVTVERGDILLNITGDSVARVCLVDEQYLPARVNQHVLIIRPNPREFDSRFLRYYLVTPKMQNHLLGIAAVGATRNALTKGMIESLEVPKPDLSVQKNIADKLESLDNKITLNRQINQTLEAMAQALFKSWFVDFEPVKAKMSALAVGGSVDDANLAAMSAISGKTTEQLLTLKTTHPDQYQQLYTTADLFPSEMVDSELGEIPKGWEVKAFGEFIERMPVGKKFDQKTAFVKGSTPILDQGKSGVIGFHNETPGVRASLENPVVVFANHTCYMRLVTFDFSAIQNVLPFVGKDDLDTIWVYYATKDTVKFSEYKGHWPDFVLSKAVVPPSNLTSHFRKFLQPFISQTRNLELESEKLNEIKNSLLPKLLSGELGLDMDNV